MSERDKFSLPVDQYGELPLQAFIELDRLPTAIAPLGDLVTVNNQMEHTERGPTTETSYSAEAPEDSVDTFLAAQASLFTTSEEAWQDVRAMQRSAETSRRDYARFELQAHTPSSSNAPLVGGKVTRYREPRFMRRLNERQQSANLKTTFSVARNESQRLFNENIQHDMHCKPDGPEQDIAIAESVANFEEAQIKQLRSSGCPEAAANELGRLQTAYLHAIIADYRVVRNTAEFLADDAVVPAFVDRLQELSTLGNKGVFEFPGALELLAAHNAQLGNKSVIHQAVERTAANPAEYAYEFISHYVHETETETELRTRKELSVAIGAMKLTAAILRDECNVPTEDYMARFAAHWQSWPPQLVTALKAHSDAYGHKAHLRVKNALTPFVRPGRLMATGTDVSMQNETSPKARRGSTKAGIKPKNSPSLQVARNNQDMEDVSTPETARKPIDNFAYLKNSGSTAKQNILRLDRQGTIDDLLDISHVRTYLAKYQHEPRLKDTVQAALEKLRTDPFDRTSTRVWKGVHYYLEDSKKIARNLRRFSMQDFPDVAGGSIAAATRIAYSIVKDAETGEPTIALYGIFLKQDIESINSLPKRR